MLEHLRPVKHFGVLFDRGMTLFEFDALREPENSRFKQIGDFVKSKVEMIEVPTPQMLWDGCLFPDLYISNRLDAVPSGWCGRDVYLHPSSRLLWPSDLILEWASIAWHGKDFHDEFIEPMCRKISGRSSAEISAKFNRSLWLPLYWPETLRARQSLPTRFYYPKAGYAGAVRVRVGEECSTAKPASSGVRQFESADLALAFVIAKPIAKFSVLFVVDPSPIFRVTDQDVCAGIESEDHRMVVEYRGPCNVMLELERLGIASAKSLALGSARLELPMVSNLKNGWKPRPTINDQLWELM